MAKTNYDDKRASLAQMLKNEPAPAPMQEVRPVATKSAAEEVKLNFFVPAELAKKIKVYAAQTSRSIKDISIEAYEVYFAQLSK